MFPSKQKLVLYWHNLSISRKFTISFGFFISLITLITVTNYISIKVIQNNSNNSLSVGVELESVVWDLDRNLQEARILRQKFLLDYPKIGFNRAKAQYSTRIFDHINRVVQLLNDINNYSKNRGIKKILDSSGINLNLYLSSAERYRDTFNDFLDLVTQLAEESNGLEVQMKHISDELYKVLIEIGDPQLLNKYREMINYEKDYIITKKRPYMHSAFNIAYTLTEDIKNKAGDLNDLKDEGVLKLQLYQEIGDRVLDINSDIRKQLNDFELQSQTVNPISEQLVSLVKEESGKISNQIGRMINYYTIVLIVVSFFAIIMAVVTAKLLDKDITKNIIKLTSLAGELKNGNLEVNIDINRIDEIGILANNFVAMRDAIKEKIFILNREINERKKIEEEIRHLNEDLENRVVLRTKELELAKNEAETANRAKSSFLANMSHELRTPLNGILGYAQILKNDLGNREFMLKGLKVIENSGNHLLTLINDILDLAKIEAKKMELSSVDIELRDFIDQIVDIIKVKAMNKGLSMDLELSRTLPLKVHTDEKKLRQILLNILGNAVKFTQKGGITFVVEVINKTVAECVIRFTIEDTGVGVITTEKDKIFDKFEQVGNKEVQSEGTGLGLAISKQIVELMGGELMFDSEYGMGSRFWFDITLPVIEDGVTIRKEESSIIGYSGDEIEILVVDDHESNRLFLEDLLSPLGFKVITANNGREAVDMANKFKPSVILMDLLMPVMTGSEAAKEIRNIKDLEKTLIIAVTASVMKLKREERALEEFDSIIPKPVVSSDLFSALKKFLGIEWVYSAEKNPEKDNLNLIPEQSFLQKLLDASEYHNYTQIESLLEELLGKNYDYYSFVENIRSLAQEYEMKKIQKTIKNLINK